MAYTKYPKIHSVGHREVRDIFSGPVVVEEKIDGSQISFGVFDSELKAWSRGQQIDLECPQKLFAPAIGALHRAMHDLVPGWIYRGECVSSKRHNVLTYDRVPSNCIVLYDIVGWDGDYLNRMSKVVEAGRAGFEVVPQLYAGWVHDLGILKELSERESMLGGCTMEGVVIKNYNVLPGEPPMLAKLVREQFKEKMRQPLPKPQMDDIIAEIAGCYKTEARWHKAVQHLTEAGKITGTPADIGPVVKEVQADTLEECGREMKDALWAWAWPKIRKELAEGLAFWYKDLLAGKQFAVGAA